LTRVAKLVYASITSLDGYIADEDGDFQWGAPDEELSTFINDIVRPFGTNLYGRRMYETMVFWETFDATGDVPPYIRDYTMLWRTADKIVYSRTLKEPSSARTRIEENFEVDAVRRLKETSDHDLSIGGAILASEFFKAGLVDEMHLFVTPITVGGGTSALPAHHRNVLELLHLDRFASGAVHLHYLIKQ
jgi:dihydrofolate reductase